ncbi:unnamed protein product [Moneuplotes crassus]|uniref:Uncharacterized protein n=1 Tax=Euplotes crassus TaxID=5936 RepID=A0AAD1YB83_EUPCR|nr:unnamed protein product [Moneuplotes crassus]
MEKDLQMFQRHYEPNKENESPEVHRISQHPFYNVEGSNHAEEDQKSHYYTKKEEYNARYYRHKEKENGYKPPPSEHESSLYCSYDPKIKHKYQHDYSYSEKYDKLGSTTKEVNSHPYHKSYEESKRNFVSSKTTAKFPDAFESSLDSIKLQNIEYQNKDLKMERGYERRSRPEEVDDMKSYNIPPAEEGSPETTRYRPSQSSPQSSKDEGYPQYDLSEIELPAYCNDHPDSKLLYLTQDGDDEILCCVYCALEQKQKYPNCNVIEISDYLQDLIKKTKEVCAKPSGSSHETNSVCSQIISENDKEISRIKEYYSKVMEALALERDEKIKEIGKVTNKNISKANSTDSPSLNEKVKNFENELLKVISGVKETGIHIKELQKIRYDYDEVLSDTEQESTMPESDQIIEKYEFVMLSSEALQELANKLGHFRIREVKLSDYDKLYKNPQYYSNTRNNEIIQRDEVPTFGMSNEITGLAKERKRVVTSGVIPRKDYDRDDSNPLKVIESSTNLMRNSNFQKNAQRNIHKENFGNIDPIPPSAVSYFQNSSQNFDKYNQSKNEEKRSKSIEGTSFRERDSGIESGMYKYNDENAIPPPTYKDLYSTGAGSPVNILYNGGSFRNTDVREYIPNPKTLKENLPKPKSESRKSKHKTYKIKRF